MLRSIFFTCFILCSLQLSAQYNFDLVNAPWNIIPELYKAEHLHIKGPVKFYSDGYHNYDFDNEGYITGLRKGKYKYKYLYNEKKELMKVDVTGISNYDIRYKNDGRGRIIERITDKDFEQYIYDADGNYLKTLDKAGNIISDSYIFSYDKQNRLTQQDYYYDGKKEFYTTIKYELDKPFLKVTTTYNSVEEGKSVENIYYYKNGYNYQAKKSDLLVFDKYGNPLNDVDLKGDIDKLVKKTYVYYTDDAGTAAATTNKADCIEGNCEDGIGTKHFAEGLYVGFFTGGKRDGYGVLKYASGELFQGSFKNDMIDGFGILTFKNGGDQMGIFKNGKLNGRGDSYFSKERNEMGIYVAGKLVTPYTNYPTKDTMKCVQGDCWDKYGKYKYSNGGTFIGFFNEGYMSQGSWYAPNGDNYIGEFSGANKFTGMGLYKYANGDSFNGFYKNNQRHGRGIFYDKALNKETLGEWENGVLVNEYDF